MVVPYKNLQPQGRALRVRAGKGVKEETDMQLNGRYILAKVVKIIFVLGILLFFYARMMAPHDVFVNRMRKFVLSNQKQYISAVEQYVAEHEEYPNGKEDLAAYMTKTDLDGIPDGAEHFVGYENGRFVVWTKYNDIYEEKVFQ